MFFRKKKEETENLMEKFEQKLNQRLEEKLLPIGQNVEILREEVKEANQRTDALIQSVGRFQTELHKHDMSLEDLLEEWEEKSSDTEEVRSRFQEYEQGEKMLLKLFEAYQEQFFQMKGFAAEKDTAWAQQLTLMEEKLARLRQECDISVIEECGIPVNYDLYEVIEVKDTGDSGKNNLISDVYQCGYIYKGRIMKKAKAAVYRAAEAADPANKEVTVL